MNSIQNGGFLLDFSVVNLCRNTEGKVMDDFSHTTGVLFQDKDPFVDDINAEFHIGSVKIWLQSTSYMVCLIISNSQFSFSKKILMEPF